MVAIGIRFISKIGIVEVMLTVSENSLFAYYSGSFCLICLSDKQAMIGLMQNCDPQSWPVWECNQLAGNNRQEFIQWAIQIFDQQRYETISCALRGSKLYSVFFEVFLKDVLFECLCGRVSSSGIDQGTFQFASLCFPSFFWCMCSIYKTCAWQMRGPGDETSKPGKVKCTNSRGNAQESC